MQIGNTKIGLGQIGQPSPARFKWWVNFTIVVVLPFAAGFLLIVPEGIIDPLITGFVGKLLPLIGGALKMTEKLLGDTSHENYNTVYDDKLPTQ